jgi:hypothetical protein
LSAAVFFILEDRDAFSTTAEYGKDDTLRPAETRVLFSMMTAFQRTFVLPKSFFPPGNPESLSVWAAYREEQKDPPDSGLRNPADLANDRRCAARRNFASALPS